ncbi:TRAP transporter small permease [Enterovirga rhinocerotis]|uniref:TRAP transporter small permease n=1 Tax=Enterovirga rhinocerotis TaxID=1339210 RepID=UPI001414EF2E|nr:TRAP transporter small permease [Enterovirga rhinocerotis]
MLALSIVSGFATLLIIVIVTVDVAGRFLFNMPFHGGVEASELLMVVLVFFGLAAAQQQRQNYTIELLVRHLPPQAQRGFELVGYLVCFVIVVMLAWPSTKQALSSFERGEAGFGVVPFPLWPARILLAVGLWLLAVQFLCDIYRFFADRPHPAEAVDAPKVFE